MAMVGHACTPYERQMRNWRSLTTGWVTPRRAAALRILDVARSAGNLPACTPTTTRTSANLSSSSRTRGCMCMQLIQPAVQKSIRAILPRRSDSFRGLPTPIQSRPSAKSGACTVRRNPGAIACPFPRCIAAFACRMERTRAEYGEHTERGAPAVMRRREPTGGGRSARGGVPREHHGGAGGRDVHVLAARGLRLRPRPVPLAHSRDARGDPDEALHHLLGASVVLPRYATSC